MLEFFALVFTVLSTVIAVAYWRRILLPKDHPQKIHPPMSTWLMFSLAIVLSLTTSMHTEKATLLGNIGTVVDVLRAFITVAVLAYAREFSIQIFDLCCIAASLAIGVYWWRSGAAKESNWALQGIMATAYVPVYIRLWSKKTESLSLTVLAIIAGLIAFGVAQAKGEEPPQLYALRAVIMLTAMLVLVMRITEIEHRRVPIGELPAGYKVYRFFALRKCDPFYHEARAYVLYWIRNPDPGSWFDRMTWWYRTWLPLPLLFGALRLSGRDCILLCDDSGVVAHVFWHRWLTRRAEIRMFNVEVREDRRGRGLMRQILVAHFGLYCYHLPGVFRVQLSAGGKRGKTARYDPAAVAYVYQKLAVGEWRICEGAVVRGDPDFWLDFFLKRERACSREQRTRKEKEVALSR